MRVQETVSEALRGMQELAQHILKTNIYPTDMGLKLQQIQVAVDLAVKGNAQEWKVAKSVYAQMTGTNAYLVPKIITSLINKNG